MVGPDKDGSMKKVREYAASLNLSISTKLNVKTDLIIPGRMAKADWHELSKSYDIFINTTNFDNTPVSVIEAMALGLPVVSTKAGGIPYLIKNSVDGYLIEKENVQAMKEKIELIIEQPPCISQELILKARKKVEAFDWQVVKEKWIEILD